MNISGGWWFARSGRSWRSQVAGIATLMVRAKNDSERKAQDRTCEYMAEFNVESEDC